MRSEMLSDEAKDFSLALGGPIYQFFVRVGLVRPPFDRAALRIIIITLVAWTPLLLLSGFIANRVLYEGTRLPDYRFEILAVALLLYLLALGPICVFAPRLLRQRIHGLYAYGPLASEYVIEFEKKWMEGQRPEGEALVGSGDIQSLADLANSFAVVQHIQPFPFGKEAIIAVAVFMVLPILPLTLTMFSLQEIVTRLVQVLL